MPWYVYALIASVIFAIIPLQKRKYNHSPKDIVFWSSLFSFVLTLFLIPFLSFPDFDWFYLGAVFTGLSGVFGGILQFKLSEKRIGRTMSVQLPVQIIACFIFYCLLQPSYYEVLTQNDILTYLAIACVVILIVLSQFLRRTDNSFIALVSITPVSLLFAVIIVYYKLMMNVISGDPSHIILAYIMVHYFTVSVCYLLENIITERKGMPLGEKLASSSLLIAVLYVFGYYFLFLSVYHSPNPAFVLVFNLLIPVWIKIYSMAFGRKDDASFKVAMIMLLLVCIMMVAL